MRPAGRAAHGQAGSARTGRGRFLEHALTDEVPQHSVQGIGGGAGRRGQVIDLGYPGGNVVGDPECRSHVNAPRSAEIAHRPDVYLASPVHTRTSALLPSSGLEKSVLGKVAHRIASGENSDSAGALKIARSVKDN